MVSDWRFIVCKGESPDKLSPCLPSLLPPHFSPSDLPMLSRVVLWEPLEENEFLLLWRLRPTHSYLTTFQFPMNSKAFACFFLPTSSISNLSCPSSISPLSYLELPVRPSSRPLASFILFGFFCSPSLRSRMACCFCDSIDFALPGVLYSQQSIYIGTA